MEGEAKIFQVGGEPFIALQRICGWHFTLGKEGMQRLDLGQLHLHKTFVIVYG